MCPIVRAGFSCVAQTTALEEVLTLIVRVFWNAPVQWLRGLAPCSATTPAAAHTVSTWRQTPCSALRCPVADVRGPAGLQVVGDCRAGSDGRAPGGPGPGRRGSAGSASTTAHDAASGPGRVREDRTSNKSRVAALLVPTARSARA
jgi:hypothetical protein